MSATELIQQVAALPPQERTLFDRLLRAMENGDGAHTVAGKAAATRDFLALAAACGIISLRHTDLHAATDAFLLRHRIDPERHYTRLFIESVAKATNHHVGEIAAFALAYAVIRLVEGYGLWQGKHWAEWFAVISAGIYLTWNFSTSPTTRRC